MTKKTFMAPRSGTAPTPARDTCGDLTYGSTAASGTTTSNNSPTGNRSASNTGAGAGRGFVNPSSVSASSAGAGRGFVNPDFVKPDNAYKHETGNIITNSSEATVTGTSFDDLSLRTEFQPNILDNYDAVTYKWKLFITDPYTSSQGNVLKTDSQIIIAESGVTDLTIDNVVITGVTTPTVGTGTGVATEITFDITEPGGAGMIDKIFYQSLALGIGNWSVMPLYLELQFKGRDPETSSPIDGSPGSLSSLKWLWVLKITEIKTHVTHAGTKYEFSTILYNDFGQSNINFTLRQNVVLENIGKFGDAMEKLQNKLNSDQFETLIENYSIPDTFRIIVDPKLALYDITPNVKNENSHKSWNYSKFENKDAHFQSGTGLDKVIDSLLAQTEQYQKLLTGASTPGSEGQTSKEEPSQMKKFWRIITETRPIRFDPRRQNTANEFVIFIVEYNLGVLDSNVFQTSAPPVTTEAQKKRLMTYLKNSILRKRYDYLFTGLNDQILDFDLKINCSYANSMARYGGIYNNSDMSSKGVVNQNNAQDEANVTSLLNKVISLQNNAKTANSKETQAATIEAKNAIDTAKISDADKERYRILLEQSKPENRVNYVLQTQNRGATNQDGTFDQARNEAIFLSKPISDRITQKQYRFISDVDITDSTSKYAYSEYLEYMRNSYGKLRPIARVESMQDMQIGQGIESNSNSGLQKLSTMFAVALHSGLDASFANIKMTIKGDPYWLFPQPINSGENFQLFKSQLRDINEAISLIKNGYYKEFDYVNYYSSDNFLLLRFRTPKIYNNTDVNQNSTDASVDVQTFSGVYKLTQIRNKFEGGKFTQELECLIDPEIMYLDIADTIEEISRTKNPKTSANELIRPVVFPDTVIRQDRIPNNPGT